MKHTSTAKVMSNVVDGRLYSQVVTSPVILSKRSTDRTSAHK